MRKKKSIKVDVWRSELPGIFYAYVFTATQQRDTVGCIGPSGFKLFGINRLKPGEWLRGATLTLTGGTIARSNKSKKVKR